MDDKCCDMCKWFSMDMSYCTRYREEHFPTDGMGCPGWDYWDDPWPGEENRNDVRS